MGSPDLLIELGLRGIFCLFCTISLLIGAPTNSGLDKLGFLGGFFIELFSKRFGLEYFELFVLFWLTCVALVGGLLTFLGFSINCIGGLEDLGDWSFLLVTLLFPWTLFSYCLLFEKLELFFCSVWDFDVEIIWGGFNWPFLEIFCLLVNFEILGFVSRGFEILTAFKFLFFEFVGVLKFFELSSTFFAGFCWGLEFKDDLLTDKMFLLLFTLFFKWFFIFFASS